MYAAKFPAKMLTLKKHVWKVCIFFPRNLIPSPCFFFKVAFQINFGELQKMYSVICTIHVLQGFIFPFCRDFFQSTRKYWLLQNCAGIFKIDWRYKCQELTGFSHSLWTHIKLYVKYVFLPNRDSSSINAQAAVPGACWKEQTAGFPLTTAWPCPWNTYSHIHPKQGANLQSRQTAKARQTWFIVSQLRKVCLCFGNFACWGAAEERGKGGDNPVSTMLKRLLWWSVRRFNIQTGTSHWR